MRDIPIPAELCGIGGCVFMPHDETDPHTWETGEHD